MYCINATFQCIKRMKVPIKYVLKHSTRCFSNKIIDQKSEYAINSDLKKNNWTTIYRFPHISLAAFLNRFKLYQTTFLLISIPTAFYLQHHKLVDPAFITTTIGCTVFACATLYFFTSYFKRLIGIIYVNEDKSSVKISHLTFWGKRNDIVVKLEDIIPLTDGVCNPKDAYVKVERYSTKENLYLTIKYGKVIDDAAFKHVFGNFENLK